MGHRSQTIALVMTLGSVTSAGCILAPTEPSDGPDEGRTSFQGTSSGSGEDDVAFVDPDDDTDGTPSSGLPCDVEFLLLAHCRGCHGDPPERGPFPLVTLEDLRAPHPDDPTLAIGEVALDRMLSETDPMPPAPAPLVDVDSIDLFASWVLDGMPASDEVCP